MTLTENAVYIPQGFVDCEDGSGTIVHCDWRGVVGNDETGLASLGSVGSNHYGFDALNAGEFLHHKLSTIQ